MQAALDDRLQSEGDAGDQGGQRRERLDGDLDGEGGEGLGAEGAETRQQLVEHDAQRPDVRARVDLARLADLLRRHVRRRAEGRVGGGQIVLIFTEVGHLGDAEVENLDQRRSIGAGGEEEVGGLEVAVDDAERMRLGQRLARLQDVPHGLRDRQPLASVEHSGQRLPVEVLHDHEGDTLPGAPHVHDPDPVLALDPRRRPRLPQESLEHLPVEHVPQHDLDGHPLGQLPVVRGQHKPHATPPEDLLDEVLVGDEGARDKQRFGEVRRGDAPDFIGAGAPRTVRACSRPVPLYNTGGVRTLRQGFVGRMGLTASLSLLLAGCQILGDIQPIEYQPASGGGFGGSGQGGTPAGSGGEAGENQGGAGEGGAGGPGGAGSGGEAQGGAGQGGACQVTPEGSCEVCLAESCCSLLAACKAKPGCMACFNSSAPCDDMLAYELIHCGSKECSNPCDLISPDCSAPAEPVSKGACIPSEAKYVCNPVKGDSCSGNDACEFVGNGTACLDSTPLAAGLCAPCGFNGRYCSDGMTCFNSTCARFCCGNQDCGSGGYCDLQADVGQGNLKVGICAR